MGAEWIVTSSMQVAHLFPADWEAGSSPTIRAACGATFKRRGVAIAVRKLPAERHAVLHCYRCSRAQERGEGGGATLP